MEYFNWLEQEAEEQRRDERRERAQRFGGLGHVSAGLLLWLESDNETDSDDGREAH